MKQMVGFLILVLALGACSSKPNPTVAKEGQIPLEDFFRNPVANNVEISPVGDKLAALKPLKGRMNVFVRPTDGEEWVAMTSMTDRDISWMAWKNNDMIVFMKDFGGDENFHLFSLNLKNKEVKELTPFPKVRVQPVDMLDEISETDLLIGMNKRDPQVFDVYRVNTASGSVDLVLENTKKFSNYIVDNKGQLRVAIANDGVNNTIYYRDTEKSEFKKVKALNFKETLSPIAFDKDNKNIYGVSNLGRNTAAAVTLNPKTGQVQKTLFQNKDYDVSSVIYSRKRKELVAAVYIDAAVQRHFFSPYYKGIYADLTSKIPNRELSLPSATKDEDVFVVSARSDRTLGEYYLYDAKTKKLQLLLNRSPWIKEEQMAEMKPISYKSRDGLTIHGYLTTPVGKDPKNLPVVINPHGGPWARDVWGFSPQVQFLANRGYAVLQMNFRGSTGYGKKFWMASFKEWGLKMQDDITDGVNWMVKEQVADKDRVCIYGASYGGYAVLAGLAFTPEVYKCGIDYVGVSNIFTLMETVPPYWVPMREKLYEMVGHPEKEKELVKKASPLFSADKIKSPLFVAQGAKDPRVKKSESDQIVDALKKRGIDVPYLVKEDEGHGFRNEENRMEFMRQMEAFLAKHINNESAGTKAPATLK